MYTVAIVGAVLLVVVFLLHEEFVAVTLDREMARSSGLPVLMMLLAPVLRRRAAVLRLCLSWSIDLAVGGTIVLVSTAIFLFARVFAAEGVTEAAESTAASPSIRRNQ